VTTDGTLRLTDLLGRPVVASDGRSLGRLADLAIDHEDRFPRVTALAIRAGRTITVRPWSAVRGLGPPVVLDPGAGECRADLYLAHDLLDAQVIDIAGRRLARVSEIALALHGGALRAVAVDVGLGSVVRRLGLGRLASRMGDEMIGWDGLHFASAADTTCSSPARRRRSTRSSRASSWRSSRDCRPSVVRSCATPFPPRVRCRAARRGGGSP
jgi:sporulation protein YlmC with PRC-barrel domain